MTQSMHRIGRWLNNAPIKGFWCTLKVEMYYLREFLAYRELTSAINIYISFYNHEGLNGLNPVEYGSQTV